jgi:small subunit ribosomal protein S6
MNKYEIMFIVRPNLEEGVIKEEDKKFNDILKKQKAKLLDSKELGQKELAYIINKHKTGYYYLYQIESSVDTIKEIDRLIRINENIIRHLIIKLDN